MNVKVLFSFCCGLISNIISSKTTQIKAQRYRKWVEMQLDKRLLFEGFWIRLPIFLFSLISSLVLSLSHPHQSHLAPVLPTRGVFIPARVEARQKTIYDEAPTKRSIKSNILEQKNLWVIKALAQAIFYNIGRIMVSRVSYFSLSYLGALHKFSAIDTSWL